MRTEYFSEINRQLLFSMYDSSKKQKNNQLRIHKHSELEIGFITNGNGTYLLNQHSYEANPGDLFVVRPNEFHCIPTITSSKLVAFNIHFTPYYLWNICTDFIEPNKIQALIHSEIPITQYFSSNEKINYLIKKIWKIFHDNKKCNRFEIRNCVLELMNTIAQEITVPETKSDFSDIRLPDIQKSIDFIRKNYNKPISLDDIANSAAMSRSYYINNFKQITGTTPYEYLLSTRLENACNLLIETNHSILQISYDCGFKNVANFNKIFKEKLGETPTSLRSRYQS